MDSPPRFSALETFLAALEDSLFAGNAPLPVARVREQAGALTSVLRASLEEYATTAPPPAGSEPLPAPKLAFKPTLKYAQDVLDHMTGLLRGDQEQLARDDDRVRALHQLLHLYRELVAIKYRFLAERELRVFHDADFKKRLAESLERKLGG